MDSGAKAMSDLADVLQAVQLVETSLTHENFQIASCAINQTQNSKDLLTFCGHIRESSLAILGFGLGVALSDSFGKIIFGSFSHLSCQVAILALLVFV